MTFIPPSWKDFPSWQRIVAQYVNPIIQGLVGPQYEAAPSPAQNEGYGYYDLAKHGPAWFDNTEYRYVLSSNSSGNVSITGTLTVAGLSTLAGVAASGNVTVGGTLGVTGVTTLTSLVTSGNATVGGTLGAGATTLASLTVTNASQLNTLAVNAVTGSGSITTTGALGYRTGAGGTVTQTGSRTSGVTLNKLCGAITLVSAAGSTTFASFTVTNSQVDAIDTVIVNQKSGSLKYRTHVTNLASGSFEITFAATSGTTTEQPVFNFTVIKAVAS